MKPFNRILSMLLVTGALEPAHAQVTLDVAKITCDQFLLYKITDPRDIALWINGYFNGQRKNTVLDTQKLKDHFDKLKLYCVVNPTLPVFEATQKVLETN
jgi:acid stress chaperone HdeB